jgi:polyisoprenoid-binding protein YceI
MADNSVVSLTVPAAGTYRLDPDKSTIHYSGKHRFGTGTVHATFKLTSGDILVADPLTYSSVSLCVDANSFASNSAKRDKDVRTKMLLDVAAYPDINFSSKQLLEDGDNWIVAGEVTTHDHTLPVEVTIDRVTQDGDAITLHGRADHLDRYALGVTKGKGMVGRYLDLELDAVAHHV